MRCLTRERVEEEEEDDEWSGDEGEEEEDEGEEEEEEGEEEREGGQEIGDRIGEEEERDECHDYEMVYRKYPDECCHNKERIASPDVEEMMKELESFPDVIGRKNELLASPDVIAEMIKDLEERLAAPEVEGQPNEGHPSPDVECQLNKRLPTPDVNYLPREILPSPDVIAEMIKDLEERLTCPDVTEMQLLSAEGDELSSSSILTLHDSFTETGSVRNAWKMVCTCFVKTFL